VDARDVDLTVTRMRRPGRSGPAASRMAYPTDGSAALAAHDLAERPTRARRPGSARLAVAPPPVVAVPRTPFVVLVLLVVVGGVVGILLLNTKVNENAFIVYDLRQEQAELDQRQQELEEWIARADSPSQLAAAARRMGLVRAEEPAYLRLPGGTVVFQGAVVPEGVVPEGVVPGGVVPEPGQPGG